MVKGDSSDAVGTEGFFGAGKPLFIDIKGRKKLKLIDLKAYSTGLVMLTYKPDRK